MEFPHLGKHCSEPSCNRLDFLPVKCDACDKVFCSSHYSYDRHNCPRGHRKDVQVPICPLCGEPVPTAPDVAPDLTVGQHIDQQCKSDTKKIFTNRCSYKGCKRKELMPISCGECKQNFCLRHRHTTDHECKGNVIATPDPRILAANAAEYRRSHKPTTLFNANPKPSVSAARANTTHLQTVQGNMTEDEALARALALSIMELDESADRNRRNEAAAAEAAAAQQGATVRVGGSSNQNQGHTKDKCSLS